MSSRLLKFSLVCVAGVIVLSSSPKIAYAYEEAVAGFSYDKIISTTDSSTGNVTVSSFSIDEITVPGYDNIGIADVDKNSNLLIRSSADKDAKILGKLPRHGGCDILEEDKGSGWTKVSSGKVKGYVKSEFLITGAEASKLASKVGNYIATANTDGLRVRKTPDTDAEVLDQVAQGEDLVVLDETVTTYGKDQTKWVKVSLDSDDSEDGTPAYVAKEFVDLSYSLKQAVSMEEINNGSSNDDHNNNNDSNSHSSTRGSLINFAMQYLGDPYVWGGTTLGRGVDCSGFTQAIYRHFGISIARVSRSQACGGTRVASSSAKPGDLIFYGNSSSGYINHVALYIGGGRILHASNPRDGIKISNMYYRQPVKCVRYLGD